MTFSPEELAILSERSFFETRAAVEPKLQVLFMELQRELLAAQEIYRQPSTERLFAGGARLGRGEHYGAFPYRVLDSPRHFYKHELFAYRALFLYGHGFSVHLLVAGAAQQLYRKRLATAYQALKQEGWFISQHRSPWRWAVMDANTLPLEQLTMEQYARLALEHPFLKLSRYLPALHPNLFVGDATRLWQQLAQLLFISVE